jgi:hypothetical protein
VIFHAILEGMPTAPRALNPALPLKLDEIINKALDKDLETRYQSAAEIRGDLKRLKRDIDSARTAGATAGRVSTSIPIVATPTGETTETTDRPSVPRTRLRWMVPAGLIFLLAGLAATFFMGQQMARLPLPTFHLLTYRRGTIRMARLAPDGQTVIYSAAWEGGLVRGVQHPPGEPGVAVAGAGWRRDSRRLARWRDGGTAQQPASQIDVSHWNAGPSAAGGWSSAGSA